jgi:ATP-dependent Clp protease ATP-binding subunit ClpA
VLALAAEESERQGHQHIGVLHLLAGLLREEKSSGALLLHERGLQISAVREELGRETGGSVEGSTVAPLSIATGAQPLTLPVETLAELSRRAHASGVKVQSILLSLLKNALGAQASGTPPAASEVDLKETYQRLRGQIEAEGWPCLDAAQLEEEQARRKGSGRT